MCSHADSWEISVFNVLDNGRQTTYLICQLVFQVWVWLTENNEGEKSVSRSKKLPFVPKGNEIETKTSLWYCGSSSLMIHKPDLVLKRSPPLLKADAKRSCQQRLCEWGQQWGKMPVTSPSVGTASHELVKGVWLDTRQVHSRSLELVGGKVGWRSRRKLKCLRHDHREPRPYDVRFTEQSTPGPANTAWQ